jgi:hypothetical protein
MWRGKPKFERATFYSRTIGLAFSSADWKLTVRSNQCYTQIPAIKSRKQRHMREYVLVLFRLTDSGQSPLLLVWSPTINWTTFPQFSKVDDTLERVGVIFVLSQTIEHLIREMRNITISHCYCSANGMPWKISVTKRTWDGLFQA